MKKIFILIIYLSAFMVYAQSNEQIDQMMKADKTTLADASLLILSSAGIIDTESDSSSAVKFINDKKWYKTKIKGDSALTAGNASYIFMQAFKLNGGLMYKIAPGPRYAVREMKYNDILDKRTETSSIMSGEDFLIFLSEALSWQEENL